MVDVSKPLRDKFYAALSGLTYNSESVNVYEVIPQDVSTPFIVLGNQTDSEESVKQCEGHNATITIQIFMDYPDTTGTKDDVDQISEDIFALDIDLSPDLKNVVGTLDMVDYLVENFNTFTRVRKVIVLRFIIAE